VAGGPLSVRPHDRRYPFDAIAQAFADFGGATLKPVLQIGG
jgi:hypothetical protein